MKLGAAIAEIMKREGIEILCGYPVNHLIEYAADRRHPPDHGAAGAHRPAHGGRDLPRHLGPHDRRLLHAARPRRGERHGGVAQCYGESVPVLVLPMGYPRRLANIDPNFNSSQAMKAFSKSSEPINHRQPKSPTSSAAPSPSCGTAAAGR